MTLAASVMNDFAFSADGSGGDRRLPTGPSSGCGIPRPGPCELELRGHGMPVRSGGVQPGRVPAGIGRHDGLVRVWALDLDDLIAIATERVTRNFTDDECRQYLHLERCPEA